MTNDAATPTIAITNPTSGPNYVTTNAIINLSGTASDNTGISLITWENFYGSGIGTASGTTNWSIPGIQLQPGPNDIWLTAFDLAGNEGYAALTVTRSIPGVFRITDATLASNGIVEMNGAGLVGAVFSLQTSVNLIQWYNIGIVTNETGTFQFSYTFSKLESRRFFRLAQFVAPLSGTVVAWGRNNAGQRDVPPGLSNVVAIAGAGDTSLALKFDGTVVSWGDQTSVPSNVTNVASVALGICSSLSLTRDRAVVAWGCAPSSAVPSDLTDVISVASGFYHSLALNGDGTVAEWGQNLYGETSLPPGLTKVVAISAGVAHSLALISNAEHQP